MCRFNRQSDERVWQLPGVAWLATASILPAAIGAAQAADDTRPLTLTSQNASITRSAHIHPATYSLPDPGHRGAVHIQGDDLVVDFAGARLLGNTPGQAPNTYTGTGIVVQGSHITLRNVAVHGYRVGIHAREASGLVIENADLSDNYRQHLASTPRGEVASDWLYPHHNDDHEWLERYGAALYIEKSNDVKVRRVYVRRAQNGIILDRVCYSQIRDNDCSFLSGWGLAMWRSSSNVVSRNAFDFCVRGYSHGVYNRGQDSAGILMFEQCNRNLITENSATHCGDGLFGFGGEASLAGSGRTGNNGNQIVRNDFSYAAAHGVEMTFSFDNVIAFNRLVGNAICGVWAGYSQDTAIHGNLIQANGGAGYGLEGGGVNIEHGWRNRIFGNTFSGNSCAVYLWSDDDVALLKRPWCQANHRGSADNLISGNTFRGDRIGIRLRQSTGTALSGNDFTHVPAPLDSDVGVDSESPPPGTVVVNALLRYQAPRQPHPIGAHPQLDGRQHIQLTEWGPYDFSGPVITPRQAWGGARAFFWLYGTGRAFRVDVTHGDVRVLPSAGVLPAELQAVSARRGLHSFGLSIQADGQRLSAGGTLLHADWKVAFFAWDAETDPRHHPEAWAHLLTGPARHRTVLPEIDLNWGYRAPAEGVPADRFATLATTSVVLPAGTYMLTTTSDDGIRLWVGDQLVIEDWTHHAPRRQQASIDLQHGSHEFRIEHFEIDGYAQLQFHLQSLRQPG